MDYYKILEITENASPEVIKAAYKALAKKYHPDSYDGDNTEREKNMTEINEAYNVLSDDAKRKAYDMQRNSQNPNFDKGNAYRSNYQESSKREPKDKSNSNNDTFKEHERETATKKTWFGRFVNSFGKEVMEVIQNNNQEYDNAFLDGMTMDEYMLVSRFRHATGCKRAGYAKALEEKGLLERNAEGTLVPTCKFKWYS